MSLLTLTFVSRYVPIGVTPSPLCGDDLNGCPMSNSEELSCYLQLVNYIIYYLFLQNLIFCPTSITALYFCLFQY